MNLFEFNPNYQIKIELKSESMIFENLYDHIQDVIDYKFKTFKLNPVNLFSNYPSRSKLTAVDADKLLTEEEFEEIYGSETDDDGTDLDDDDGDYEPETKEEDDTDDDDIYFEDDP